MKRLIKILILLVILSAANIGLTNAFFMAQDKINDNSVSVGWWVKPSVTVISPNGGEQWISGSTHDITWTAISSDPAGTINSVDILLSADGGATYPVTLVSGLANTGVYSWTISGPKSMTMKVKIVATDNHGLIGSDESDNIFDPAEEPALMPTPTAVPTPTVDFSLRADKHAVLFTANDIKDFQKITYEIIYDSTNGDRGIMGSADLTGENTFSRSNLLLGTCSEIEGKVCTYDEGITKLHLKVTLTSGGSGTVLEKEIDY